MHNLFRNNGIKYLGQGLSKLINLNYLKLLLDLSKLTNLNNLILDLDLYLGL